MVCGVNPARKKYCSKTCIKKAWKRRNRDSVNVWQRAYFRKKARADWVEKVCKNCQRVFLPAITHKYAIYCSVKCRQKFNIRQYRQTEKGKALHRFSYREYINRRRANGGKFTSTEWEAIKKKYNYQCAMCFARTKLTIDHIIPVSLGGKHQADNIQPLCMPCNIQKSNKLLVSLPTPYIPLNS